MSFCTKCGNALRDGDRFCARCGEPVRDAGAKGRTAPPDRGGKSNLWKYLLAVGVILLAAAILVIFLSTLYSAAPGPEPSAETEAQYAGTPLPAGEDAAPADMAEGAAASPLEALAEIESRPDFLTDYAWEPLAAYGDLNGDGVDEVIAVYEAAGNGAVKVMCDLWRLEDTPRKLSSVSLYDEVGGNGGYAGIVARDGVSYLAIVRQEPAGEVFHNYYQFIPWDEAGLGAEDVYMECHGSYTGEGETRYILGDAAVSREEFEARQSDFSNFLYKIDLLDGAGNGDVMTFDDMKAFYG